MAAEIFDLRHLLEEIRSLIEALCAALQRPGAIRSAAAYELPLRAESGNFDTIPVNAVSGVRALELALEAYRQLDFLPHQHPNMAYRVPGHLVVATPLYDLVALINLKKDLLKATIESSYPDPVTRPRALRTAFPGVSMLNVYRHIHYHRQPMSHLTYTWIGGTLNVLKLSHEAAIKLLNKTRDSVPETLDAASWQAIVDREIELVLSYQQIVRRRPLAPHTRYLITSNDSDAPPLTTLHANTPLILEAQSAFTVSPLTDYDRAHQRKARSTRAYTPIIPKLHIYAVVKP